MRFAIFRPHLSKLLHLSHKIISVNLKIWCSKTQPFSGNQRPCACHAKQKWSEHVVLLTCWLRNVTWCVLYIWLRNVRRAITACTFSTSQLRKVRRTWGAFAFFSGKCASHHNGVVLRATTACNFSSLICPAGSAPAALASLLFDPPEPQIIGKTQCFATFLPFRAPGSSFFWDFLFFKFLSSLLFADSSHLCFSSVHIFGSLTSKLPSNILWWVLSTNHIAHGSDSRLLGTAGCKQVAVAQPAEGAGEWLNPFIRLVCACSYSEKVLHSPNSLCCCKVFQCGETPWTPSWGRCVSGCPHVPPVVCSRAPSGVWK